MLSRKTLRVWIGVILLSGMFLIVPEAWPQICTDLDSDGYGTPASALCEYPDLDCDDTNRDVHPGAAELCDGNDNDCDGHPLLEEADDDGDGYMICEGDCNDEEGSAYPGASEIQCNQMDDDCNGSDYCAAALGWVIRRVDGSTLPDDYDLSTQGVSLAVDGLDQMHMSNFYSEEGLVHFEYASNASGSWVTETVLSPGDSGRSTSIDMDRDNKAHISYDAGSSGLMYATNASGAWMTEAVDSGGWCTSITLDTKNKAHISYSGSSGLMYATNASGAWMTENLDAVDVDCTSIALDSSNRVHISYFGLGYLKYATNTSGSWETETVDRLFVCAGGSIAVDSSDNVHISYYNSQIFHRVPMYATNSSGSWVTEELDSWAGNFAVGDRPSIALDSSNNVHISYGMWLPSDPYGHVVAELRHLTNASGVWVAEPVRSFFEVPILDMRFMREVFDTSIAVDSSDNVHIGFIGESYFESYYFYYHQSGLQHATNRLCFIATAASGTEFVEKIDVLRSFRDRHLANSPVGRAVLSEYYKYSLPLAEYIAKRGWLRRLVRITLLPVIGFVSVFV